MRDLVGAAIHRFEVTAELLDTPLDLGPVVGHPSSPPYRVAVSVPCISETVFGATT